MSKPIKLKGAHVGARMSAHEFLKSFEKAIRDGYTLLDKPRGLEIPSFAGIPYCFIVKAAEPEDEVIPSVETTETDIQSSDVVQQEPILTPEENNQSVEVSTDDSQKQDEVINSDEVIQDVEQVESGDEIHALTNEGEIVKPTPEELVKAATKKDALLKLAEEFGIVVPEDKKVPAAIKQYLLDQLKSSQSE